MTMVPFKAQTTAILSQIMQENKDDVIESSDRISLIKFNKKLRRIFSLVQKDSNFAQLKNQVDKLEFEKEGLSYMDKRGNLLKALS